MSGELYSQKHESPLEKAAFNIEMPQDLLLDIQKEQLRNQPYTFPLRKGEKIQLHISHIFRNGIITGSPEDGDGSFLLRKNNGKLEGFLIREASKEAYSIKENEQGIFELTPKRIGDLLCVNYHFPAQGALADEAKEVESMGAQQAQAANDLQSNPAAEGVIFIDVDGEYVSESPWNSGNPINAANPGLDERTIIEIWERVAEDYLPFNVNVTTNETVFNNAPSRKRIRCIITPTSDWFGRRAGGVAYINSFTWSSDVPAWVFTTGVGKGAKNLAEAVTHEVGHTFGLFHDGLSNPSTDYYSGHGTGETGWAPIMGVGYGKNLTHWSKGEYSGATNEQDDIAVISNEFNGIGFRTDDYANNPNSSKEIQEGNINVEGIIERASDKDVFKITMGQGGSINIEADPAVYGPNLDIQLRLLSESGQEFAEGNPTGGLGASLSLNPPAGTYFLEVDGAGKGDPKGTGYTDYSSLGYYKITGSINKGAESKLNQSITFAALPNKLTTDPDFSLSATASSGLAVSFQLVSGPASINGNTVSLNGTTGTVTIRATQSGNDTYNAATPVERSFQVEAPAKQNQNITFAAIPDKLTTDPDFKLSATASSGLAVSFQIVSGPARLSNNSISLNGTEGTVTVRASQGGNDSYNAAPPVERSFQVKAPAKQNQSITFTAIPDKLTTDPDFKISATASSGLGVSFQIVSGPATLSGNIVSINGVEGTVTIRAIQAGNSIYLAAPPVERSFKVSLPAKTDQTITFNPIPDKALDAQQFDLVASASSGLPVSFSLVSGPAELNGKTVSLLGVSGIVIIEASQAGNDVYSAAKPVRQSFSVGKLSQTITFREIPDKLTTDPNFDLWASSTSKLPIRYRWISGPVDIFGRRVYLDGIPGTVIIEAYQDGNSAYEAAEPVRRSFEVLADPDQCVAGPFTNTPTVEGKVVYLSDNDENTYWSTNEDTAIIHFGFCEPTWVTAISISFGQTSQLPYSFSLETKVADQWESLLVTENATSINGLESFDFPDVSSEEMRLTIYHPAGEPIRLNEVIFIGETDVIYQQPLADSYVQGGDYSDENYGDNSLLIIKNSTRATFDRESYLRFSLEGLSTGDIINAKLRLIPLFVGREIDNTNVILSSLDDDQWEEMGITHNNAPEAEEQIASLSVNLQNAILEFDVKSALLEAITEGKNSISLKVECLDIGANKWMLLHSKESENLSLRPALIINENKSTSFQSSLKDIYGKPHELDVEEELFLDDEILAYPNPVRDQLTLEGELLTERELLDITIADMLGRPVLHRQLEVSNGFFQIFIPVSDWPPGIYLMKVGGKHHQKSFRIQKQ